MEEKQDQIVNSNKKIRGRNPREYAAYMHQIERGEVDESSLVRRKLLLPGKGIGLNRDDKNFHIRSKIRGQNKPGKCLAPECERNPSRRGLCNTHRVYAKRLVKMGKASETNLINRGLLLPREGGLKKKNPTRSLKRPMPSKCLFPDCNDSRRKRGLCDRHHRVYLRKSYKLNPQKRKLLERDLIRRRLLKPRVKDKKDSSAFELGSKIKGKS